MKTPSPPARSWRARTACCRAFPPAQRSGPVSYTHLDVKADRVIYWIFVLDYVVRFSISRSKWLFVKDHVWDLLAIIPFDVLFLSLIHI